MLDVVSSLLLPYNLFLSLIGLFIGIVIGIKIYMKLNYIFYIFVGVIVAYLIGPLPYYNLPLSYSFLFSLIGLLIGNMVNSIVNKNKMVSLTKDFKNITKEIRDEEKN